MIYGRFGNEVDVIREGTLDDVKLLDKRKPDSADVHNVNIRGYVVTKSIRDPDDGYDVEPSEKLHALCYLRADGGLTEILDAVKATGTATEPVRCPEGCEHCR